MIRGIHHTSFSTRNLDEMLHFYRDLLGFQQVMSMNWEGNQAVDNIVGLPNSAGRHAFLSAGNLLLEFFEYSQPAGKPGDPEERACDTGVKHVCLDVVGIEDEYERLKKAGVRFNCQPQTIGDVVKSTYGRDPDGNIFELQEVIAAPGKFPMPRIA
jgi:glyoxylase I family protein